MHNMHISCYNVLSALDESSMQPSSVAALVKTARGKRSQQEFASILGVDQSVISRYEHGRASPSKETIDACMQIVHNSEGTGGAPTASQLARRIEKELGSPDMARARLALGYLIDAVAGKQN